MSGTRDALRQQRRLRVLEITILILSVADFILNVLTGSFMVIVPVLIVALMAWSLRVNVRTVRLIQRTHRTRLDYASASRRQTRPKCSDGERQDTAFWSRLTATKAAPPPEPRPRA